MKKLVILFISVLFFAVNGYSQATENFTNIPTNNSGSYQSRSWIGTDVVTWTATQARTDQTLTGKAICIRKDNMNIGDVTSPSYANGMGTLSFKYVRAFTGASARSIAVNVNNTLIDTITVNPNSDTVKTYTKTINISGNVVLKLEAGGAQVKIDDISWDAYASCTPPTTPPSGFSTANVTTTQMDVNWSGNGNGDNVIVVAKQGSAVNADPVSGTSYTANAAFGSGTQIGSGNYVVYNGNGSGVTVTGLTPGTTYHYAVYAYNGTDTCYLTTSKLTGNETTASPSNTIAAGAVAEPSTISSLTNTQVAASLNFDIDIQDDGGTPGTDALDTKITDMVFAQGTGNDVTDWTKVIAGAELTDGTNTMTGTVAASTITFSSINTATLGLITDNATKNYILKVWLKTDFGTEKPSADGKNLVFRIQNTNITVDNTGSGFATGQDQNSGSSNNAIDVDATVLAYVQNASDVATNASMTPAVTVSADDANGNRDLGWATPVTISSTGTLTGDPVTVSLSNGLATFSSLVHTVAATGRQLTASSTGLTSATSALFDVNEVSSATDHFRSKATGNWNDVGTWESSADGMTWINATLTPTSTANTITVKSPNTVTIPVGVTIDQLTIESGALVDVTDGTLTVADGTGDDMVVNGTLKLTQPASIITTGNIVFKSGGLYQHDIKTGTTRIPSATWETGSTCEIIGYTTGGAMSNAGYDQNFYNFTWNCPSQTSELNLAGTLTNIAGDFTVTHTGSSNLRLIGSATTITVSGNLNIGTNGELNMSGTNSKATINVSGNVNIQGLLTELSTETGSGLIHFVGTNQTLTAVDNSITNSVDFEVDCSSVTLMSNVALPANLKLTAGWLTLGNYDLDMSSSNTSITGGSTTSYIKTNGTGVLKRTVGNADVNFPVGNAAYNPAILKNAGTSDIYSLRVAYDVLTDGDSGTALTEKVVDRTWYITEAVTGGSNVEATFQWAASDELSGFDRSLCNVAHYTGGAWNEGTNGAASGSGPYTRKRTNIMTFSPFAVIGQGALPVELSYFRALKSGNTALIEWQTLSELNNAYFGIERSTDGINYRELAQIAGAGNSNTAINYHYTDAHPAPGINYYRLHQVDTDGRYSYSPVRSLSYGSAKDFSVIPTIAHSDIRIELSSPVETDARLELIEVSTGRLLQAVTLESGTVSHTIAVSHLPAGMYFIKLQNGHELTTKRFVVVK